MSVFGHDYAAAYDSLYAEKDYAAECAVLEEFFSENAAPVQRILDLGCGTGGHMGVLRDRGFEVTGVDISPEMVRIAQQKLGSANGGPRVFQGDVRDVDLGEFFDACILMFAVLGYQLTDADVAATLATARKHLSPEGLLLFDVWYGPAVLNLRPAERSKVIENEDGKMIRASSGRLHDSGNLCTVDMRVSVLRGEEVVNQVHEEHTVRYFFEPELREFLAEASFDLLEVSSFPERETATESTWSALVAARAR